MTAPVKWFAVAGSIVAVVSITLWFAIDQYYSRVESESAERPLVGGRSANPGRRKKKRPKPRDTEKGGGFLDFDTSKVQRVRR
jgi:hypothetical protein